MSNLRAYWHTAYCSMMDSRTGSGFLRGKFIRHQRELIKRNIFTIVVSGSLNRWYVIYIITQLAVYTTYIPLIYCQLGDYMVPTTYHLLREPETTIDILPWISHSVLAWCNIFENTNDMCGCLSKSNHL